jgi:hypothetical protein
MSLRKFEHSDLDVCIDMYLDFVNALEHGDDDPWTENAVAERLRSILESPVFQGWVLDEGGLALGFVLGVSHFSPLGRSYDVLELFCAANRDVRTATAQMLAELAPLLKADGYLRIGAHSSELWTPNFFNSHGFTENKDVRLFEFLL